LLLPAGRVMMIRPRCRRNRRRSRA
jgi:hypothetical protein